MNDYVKKKEDLKKVTKPWGHELWLASESTDSKYAFKEIFIKSGFKTSYQFHQFKEETNYIISGEGYLLISDFKIDLTKFLNNEYSNLDLNQFIDQLKKFNLSPGSCFHVLPQHIHAVISTDNLKMCETSTLHLDDVFRINDEYGRNHGRIDSEHI